MNTGLRNTLILGGVDALGDLLRALPTRLQDSTAQYLVTYLSEQWSTLSKEEEKNIALPTDEDVTNYLATIEELITHGQEEIAELEARIVKAEEHEKADLNHALGALSAELEEDKDMLQKVRHRRENTV